MNSRWRPPNTLGHAEGYMNRRCCSLIATNIILFLTLFIWSYSCAGIIKLSDNNPSKSKTNRHWFQLQYLVVFLLYIFRYIRHNSHSSRQTIHNISRNLMIHYRVHDKKSVGPIACQMKPIHILKYHFPILVLSFRLRLDIPSNIFPLIFPIYVRYFLSHPYSPYSMKIPFAFIWLR
jgi:hypothetical protein